MLVEAGSERSRLWNDYRGGENGPPIGNCRSGKLVAAASDLDAAQDRNKPDSVLAVVLTMSSARFG